MLSVKKIIVLSTLKYRESSLILYGYSLSHGRESYMLNGAFKSKTPLSAYLFPLSIIEAQVYDKQNGELLKIKELRPCRILDNICLNVRKSVMALFWGEILYKCLREREPNGELFAFIEKSVVTLDSLAYKDLPNYIVYHLLALCSYLGFEPAASGFSTQTPIFSIEKAQYVASGSSESFFFDREASLLLWQLQCAKGDEWRYVKSTGALRRCLIENLIRYLEYHLDRKLYIASLDILQGVFAE